MARGRMISRSLGSSRKFHALLGAGGKLGEFCQLLYPLVVSNTDDFGRMPGDAFTIKNVVLPSSPRHERDFDAALSLMHRVGLVIRYEAEGAIYLQVTQFDEHQSGLHKRTRSKFPEPPEVPGTSGIYRPNRTEQNRTEGKGTEPEAPGTAQVSASLFDEFYVAYPKKRKRDDARRAWDKRRPDRALLDVMLRAIAVQRQSPEWQKNGGQFIPYPASWLNAAMWADVLTVDIQPDGLSDTMRHNLAAGEQALELLSQWDAEREANREH